MEKLEQYRKWIIEILEEYANPGNWAPDEIEEQLWVDRQHDHYQLLAVGWEDRRRVYYSILHLDIKNGKIYVQENSTDLNIAAALEEKGVPKSDIVLAFHTPNVRQFTGYAVA